MTEVFCKTTLNEILPAIRAEIALRMLKRGFTQIEISKKLGITQPAISQYKQRVRGSMAGSIHLNESLGKYIDSMITEITESDLNINTKICRICEKTRESGVIRINPREFLCLLEIDRPSSD